MAKDAKDSKEKSSDKIESKVSEVKETKEATVSTAAPKGDWAIERTASHHYSDMAKISAGLFIGVLALMVFLLSVGLQHPKPLIRDFLYIALVALGLNLLFYQLGQIMEAAAIAKSKTSADGAKARHTLGGVRIVQQLIFAVAIVATVGFAIAASQLFFVAAATQTQPQTQ
ncbi:hypothetical protein HJC99_01060 [Candidatus Saccharibacteria bacterium]|nr:hypothetical protein [Candidatus Saccharibacteria bacterium]